MQENESDVDRRFRQDLQSELDAIRQEEIPDRLLRLALKLQSRLRDVPQD